MKGVHCSWVDMQKIRQALSGEKRGDQKRLELMRCVGKSTVSDWKAACKIVDAIEGKVRLTELSTFQPTHAAALARSFRRQKKDLSDPAVQDEAVDWVERCEDEKLTVDQLREALGAGKPKRFDSVAEGEAIFDWLLARRESWPSEFRESFTRFVRQIIDNIEAEDDVERRIGVGSSEAG